VTRDGRPVLFFFEAMRLAFRQGHDLAELPVILTAGGRAGLDGAELESAVRAPR
jgi:hypothetical protein